MIFVVVALLYDLVHPHIVVADIPHLAFFYAGDPVYQYKKEPLSPDLAWPIQGGGGPL